MGNSDIENIDLRGIQLKVQKHGFFWENMSSGQWEPSTLDVLEKYLPLSSVFVDFGGWIGPTSLYASRYCKKIIAFEPDPKARAEFSRNIELNQLFSIELRPEAISTELGDAVMWDGGSGMGNSISSFTHRIGTKFTVKTMTPAEVCTRIGPNDTYFIKMDIEGGEYAAMEAISALFSERLIGMLVAFHPRFIGGRGPGRWLTTLPKTLAAFRKFSDFRIYKVTNQGCRRAYMQERLAKANLPLFEAKDSYLFVPTWGSHPNTA